MAGRILMAYEKKVLYMHDGGIKKEDAISEYSRD
jgi:hypothetical protein